MSKTAAIFPGQGAQVVGMGRDVAEQSAAARDVFAAADATLDAPLSTWCFEGPADRLNATDVQQPAIFTTSVALYQAAVESQRIDPADFAAMGGLSLGEYTALHLAGALSFADALKLVQRRGALMQQAAESNDGGMVSIIGADESQVLALCDAVKHAGVVAPANYNCKGQIVISGDQAACEAALSRAEEFGGRAIPLKVAGAFHSAHMRPAADQFKETLAATAITTPQTPVIANVNARYHTDPDAIRQSLYQQIFQPVRWQACVERLIADGCATFIEIGPNKVLTGLMRKIDRNPKAINLSAAGDLAAVS
jgi:[acyl-carrier-protein] S-malonyltransferase